MMRFVSQMMKLPLAAFVYGMEMFVKTIQGLQRMADQSIDLMTSGNAQATAELLRDTRGLENDVTVGGSSQDVPGSVSSLIEDRRNSTVGDIVSNDATITSQGRKIMDRDLHDDMLKLIRYKVLFVKREYEYAFPEKEDLVSENMDGSAFAAWKTAEFIQELGREETEVPSKWREKEYPSSEYRKNKHLTGLPDEDKKYLRVYYEVLERYPREKFKYEEQQIRVLEQIRDKMKP